MSSGKHYIPRSDTKFDVWADDFIQNLGKSRERFGFPAGVYAQLAALHAVFKQKYAESQSPGTRTSVAVMEKNEGRAALEKAVRQAVKEYLTYNHTVNDSDRVSLCLPVRDTIATHAPVAAQAPLVFVDIHVIGILVFRFSENAHSKAKPPGQYALELATLVSDTQPQHFDELTGRRICTRSPLRVAFEYTQRGATVWYAARWLNTRGQPGPWSDIRSTIIP